MISSNDASLLERAQIGEPSRGEIVDAHDRIAAPDQGLAEVRPEEARTAGDDDPHGRPHAAHGRPIPVYTKPSRRSADGSRTLRASTT